MSDRPFSRDQFDEEYADLARLADEAQMAAAKEREVVRQGECTLPEEGFVYLLSTLQLGIVANVVLLAALLCGFYVEWSRPFDDVCMTTRSGNVECLDVIWRE